MELEKERRRQCETMREKQALLYQGLAMHGALRKRHIPVLHKGSKNNALLP